MIERNGQIGYDSTVSKMLQNSGQRWSRSNRVHQIQDLTLNNPRRIVKSAYAYGSTIQLQYCLSSLTPSRFPGRYPKFMISVGHFAYSSLLCDTIHFLEHIKLNWISTEMRRMARILDHICPAVVFPRTQFLPYIFSSEPRTFKTVLFMSGIKRLDWVFDVTLCNYFYEQMS